jgi:hypothetical protein
MKKTHHCHHATRWSSNGDDLKPKETRCNAPKTTRSRSSTYSDQFTRSFSSHQFMHNLKGKQQDIFVYLEAPWSYASNESRIKSIGGSYKQVWPNYRRLHVLNFSGFCRNKTAIAPSYGLRLRWMSTHWKGNFIKFSIEQYFGICSVMYTGENPRKKEAAATWWEQDSGDEDDDNKEKLGQWFH